MAGDRGWLVESSQRSGGLDVGFGMIRGCLASCGQHSLV